jgi:hypothetical protein
MLAVSSLGRVSGWHSYLNCTFKQENEHPVESPHFLPEPRMNGNFC